MSVVYGLGGQLKNIDERLHWHEYNLPQLGSPKFTFWWTTLLPKCERNTWMPPLKYFFSIKYKFKKYNFFYLYKTEPTKRVMVALILILYHFLHSILSQQQATWLKCDTCACMIVTFWNQLWSQTFKVLDNMNTWVGSKNNFFSVT